MKKTSVSYLFLLWIAGFLFFSCKEVQPYLNTKLSFEERADDLLSRLTIEEKAELMRFDSPAIDRLGIPAYNWWNECLHGVGRSGLATVFPQAIGMAAMWDSRQMFDIATAISDEARAKHHHYVAQGKRGIYQGLTFWTPNINIFRDPRWGRGMETYGEDPFLTAELAIPFIKGLQGDDPRYLKLVATVKHFAVHSGPESNRHSFDVYPSDYDLAETYLPHFRRSVQEAGAYSVMCAYNRLRGEPCCGDKYLEDLLRNKWGFDGYIVSDCGAISDFYRESAHHVVSNAAEASAKAVKAGTDLNCGDTYAKGLLDALKQNLITEAELDLSVRRLLLARFRLGMFDPEGKVSYAQIPIDVVDCEQHRLLALESARKSKVLLKNDNNLLPFSKEVKKVAVIGPNADDPEILLGNYNGYPSDGITPLRGIIEKLPHAEVAYAQGAPLAEQLPALSLIPSDCFYTDKSLHTKGLHAEYFDNNRFEGGAKHMRVDPNIDFVWWDTAPFEDLPQARFAIRWRGVLVPPVTGEYALGGEAFTGFKLMVDGQVVAEGRDRHHARKQYGYMQLEAGKPYEIEVEYIQDETEYAHVKILWDLPNPRLRQEAVDLARSSDLVIFCMGLSPRLEGEEMRVEVPGFAGGDRVDIKIPAVQTELMKEILQLNKPTVLVLLNGSALSIEWEAQNIPAIIEAWYPGQAGGQAIADLIFGDYNPAGRLPVTFYKDVNQIPPFDSYDMRGKTYRYFEGEPLYEFGFGLSYTTFKYRLRSIPEKVKSGDEIAVTVDVTNTGEMDGDEVVQLYVSLPESNLQKPVRALQGFRRIHLKSGETRSVEFRLKPHQIAARNHENVPVVEAGKLQVSVGGKQPDAASLATGKVVQALVEIEGDNYFINE